MSANNPGLGTLCILPREIRDEIYRHLAKGHYWFKHNTGKITSRTKVPDLTLFSVSKATHDEISSLFYSESVFQFGHDQSYNSNAFPREPILRRLMKIELLFGCCAYWPIWHSSLLKVLKNEGILRDSLIVTSNCLGCGETFLGHLSEELEAFKSFRTVTLMVNPGLYSRSWVCDEEPNYIIRVIKEE